MGTKRESSWEGEKWELEKRGSPWTAGLGDKVGEPEGRKEGCTDEPMRGGGNDRGDWGRERSEFRRWGGAGEWMATRNMVVCSGSLNQHHGRM